MSNEIERANPGPPAEVSTSLCRLLCRIVALLLAFTAAVLLCPNVRAQRELKEIPSTDPEVERQTFQVAEGFEVNLYCADPEIAKPIQINFDAAGRLWIASSEVYPHILPGQEPHDKVLVVEDADGDGRAERTSVFADGLLIPTGIEPGMGGVFVANSTQLLHLRDTDGDGRADQRRIVLSGFGTEDTHHILHTLRWGPEGYLYFNQSIYIHSHIETPYGVRRLGGGGTWQFRPDSLRLEVFTRGLVNPWGHHFDRWGQSFGTDGAGGEGINYLMPGAWYFTAPGAVRILHGLNPGSPKHCGLEVVSGRHLPDSWQGNILTNDFRANRVCRFVITDDGAGYASQEQPEVIRSTHVGFRPVDIKMGPDGAIYVADWYNPIIQHGEVDFRDPRRDHTHGRIWRITAQGRPLVERPKLVDAPVNALLDALRSPEDWTRHFAKRVLSERGRDAVQPSLSAWVANVDSADPQADQHRLEALWVYQSIEVVEPALLERLLRSADGRIRAAAVRVLADWRPKLDHGMELLAAAVADEHPRVRLEAVRALAKVGEPRAVEVAMRGLDKPVDHFMDYALWLTARELGPLWIPALARGEVDFAGRLDQTLFALEAVDSPVVLPSLMRLVSSGRLPSELIERSLLLVARVGGPAELKTLFDLAVGDPTLDASRRTGLLVALAAAAAERKKQPEGDLSDVASWIGDADVSLATAAIRAAGLWKVRAAREQLVARAEAADAPEPVRLAAIDAVAALGGLGSGPLLRKLTESDQPAAIRAGAMIAWIRMDAKNATPRLVELMADETFNEDPSPLFTALLENREGPKLLAAALADKQVRPDSAKIALRLSRTMNRENESLTAALTTAGGLTGGPRELTPDELAQLVADVEAQGDAARGEAIYRRAELNCLKCHAIGGAGGNVGPDLASIGASAQVDYLAESLLVPSKAVKENYHAITIITDEGKVFTGIPIRQTDTELVLRTGEAAEVVIQRAAIDEQAQAGSIMPAGLPDSLTRTELVDLVRFLSELGKVGSYAVGPARLVRRWEVLAATREASEQLRRAGSQVAATSNDKLQWTPAYSTVSGSLPLEALPVITPRSGAEPVGFARFQLEVTTPGQVTIDLGSIEGLSVWIDGQAVLGDKALPQSTDEPAPSDLHTMLASGPHTVTLAVELDRRKAPLRFELKDPVEATAAAQVQLVTGQ